MTQALGCVKDPLAQHIEACSAIPLPFDQFESGDMSLGLALAPVQGQSRQHGDHPMSYGNLFDGKAWQIRQKLLRH